MGNSFLKSILLSKFAIFLEVAVLVFFGFYIGKEIIQKRAIEKEVLSLEAEISKLAHQNDDLGALIEYAKTDEFIEQEAREKLNLVSSGESLVVIPDIDATFDEAKQKPPKGEILGDSNLKMWWEYFFDHEQLWID